MRLAGKQELGYFPLPLPEAERIRRFLQFPLSGCVALDPCIGDGGAFRAITRDEKVIRYGVELDAYRAEQAREVAKHVIHGDALDVHCPVESLSLLYLNAYAAGDLSSRVYSIMSVKALDRMMAAGVHTGLGNEWVRQGGIKQYADGSISERTARLSQPYLGRPDYCGLF